MSVEAYDEIYRTVRSYNRFSADRFPTVLAYAKKMGQNLLDVGCGKGHDARHLIAEGFDVFGVDYSPFCCNVWLKDIPHQCVDIISYSKSEKQYDGIVCMGTLETMTKRELDKNLAALTKLSTKALIGVSNHPQVVCGHKLHKIMEDHVWWRNKLGKFYSGIKLITTMHHGRLMIFECQK